MSSVDNRIVKMQMDNSQFKSAANSTMETLNKLASSLKLSEGAKGLENIASKVKNVDMSSLAASVESVRDRFSALDIIGVTALVNIANSAVNAGKNLVKSLTLDPIMDGFREYETKMGAIQTILTNTASKGTTMDEVNDALQELNDYSDLTIYNFAQMTDNIGKATAAGVGLKDSVTFVKGLANVAAGFGVDATRMAGATYQMTQALSAGVIKLQDWKSLEQSGMGGQMLQDSLVQTAQEMGVFVDTSVPFRQTLESNWLSSEVFIKTMDKMANDPSLVAAAQNVTSFTKLIDTMKETVGSGWAVSWEKIFGNKNQSTELFTNISKKFGEISDAMSDYRNKALEFWNVNEGRQAVLNGLANIVKSIGNLLGPIYESFKKIIDPWNGERLVSISKGFESLTERLKITDKTASYIGKTFDGIFSVFKLAGMIISPLITLLGGLAGAVTPVVDVFFKFTSILTNWASSAVGALEASGIIQKAMGYLQVAGEEVAGVLDTLISNGSEWIKVGLDYAKIYVTEFIAVMGDWIIMGKETITQSVEFVKAMNDTYKPLEKAKDFIVNVFNGIQNGIQGFLNFISDAFNNVKSFFQSIVDKVKNSGIQGIDFVNAGLFASLLLVIKKLIPFLKNFFSAVGDFKSSAIGVLNELQSTLEMYQKNIKADIIQKIAIAVGILAASIFILAKIEPERLIPAVAALGALMGGLMAAIWGFNKINSSSLKTSTSTVISLVGVAIALNILASAMNKLANLNWQQMLVSIGGLAAACIAVIALVKTIDGAKLNAAQGTSILLLATSLYVLAGAMALLGNLDIKTILQSLATIGIVLAGLSLFFKSTKGIENSIKIAASLIPLATSLLLLAAALAIFGNMDVGTLTQGFVVLAAALAELSLFVNSMRGFKGNMTSIGAGILLLSGSLIILSGALAILGNMDIQVLSQGLMAMAFALSVLAITLNLMPKNTLSLGTGLAILATGLLILGGALKLIGGLSWETIGKGMATLAGALVILGVASLLLAPITPVMLTLVGVFAAFGLAAGLVGVGLMAVSVGLTMLSGSIVAGGLAITTALISLASVIPIMAAALALGLVSFLTVLGYNGEAITRALTQILGALLQTVINNIPLFVEAVRVFLSEVMDTIKTLAPQLVDTIVTVVMSVIQALAENLPEIARLVIGTLIELIGVVLEKLADAVTTISNGITDIIVAILNAIGDNTPRVVNAAFDMIIKMINGLTDSVSTKMPQVRTAMKGLVVAIINEFKAAIGDAVDVGGFIVDGLKNGIAGGIEKVKNAARRVAESALSAAKSFLGIHSPSREFAKVGMFSDEGFAKGLSKHSGLVTNAATSVGDKALTGMQKAMEAVNDLFNNDIDSQPVIRPVLDLTDIESGMGGVNSLFNGNKSLGYGIVGGTAASMLRSISSNSSNYQNDNGDVVSAIKDLKNTITENSGPGYSVGNVTYDDGSNVSSAVKSLVRATRIKRRS